MHQHHPKGFLTTRFWCRSCICQCVAWVADKLSAGHLLQWRRRKSSVFLFWETVLPYRCSAEQLCSVYLPFKTSKQGVMQVEVGPRYGPWKWSTAWVVLRPKAIRIRNCLKRDWDLLLCYTELSIFHGIRCWSFSLSVSIRMTLFFWFLKWRNNKSCILSGAQFC